MEAEHVLGRAEVLGVLHAHDDRAPARGLGAVEVGGLADDREQLRVPRRESLPGGEVGERLLDDIRAAGADRVVQAGDAAAAERRDLGLRQRAGIGLRSEVDLERGQHVDHERALEEPERARGVARGAVREHAERGDIQHRDRGRGAGGATQQLPSRQPTGLGASHYSPGGKIYPVQRY